MKKEEIAKTLEDSGLDFKNLWWIFKTDKGSFKKDCGGFKKNCERDNYDLEANSGHIGNGEKAVECVGPWLTADQSEKILSKMGIEACWDYADNQYLAQPDSCDFLTDDERDFANIYLMNIKRGDRTLVNNALTAWLAIKKLDELGCAMNLPVV